MRRAIPLLLLLLVGCKGSREKEVVGTWKMSDRISYRMDAAKTFTQAASLAGAPGNPSISNKGTWSIDGDKVSIAITDINGKSVSDFKKEIAGRVAKMPGKYQQMFDRLGQAQIYTLAADGKTMTRTNEEGKAVTLTKQ